MIRIVINKNRDMQLIAKREGSIKKSLTVYMIIAFLLLLPGMLFAQNIVQAQSGLAYEDLIVGQGKQAKPGKIASMHIKIWINENGIKGSALFDSYSEGRPLSFKIGTKKIADGLNLGVNGMKVGGMRRLYVPPKLNPKSASDHFPAKANLIYEVKLLEIK